MVGGNLISAIDLNDYYLRMTAFEFRRLVDWMKDPKRKPANLAFTAGACRDAARAFEQAEEEKQRGE